MSDSEIKTSNYDDIINLPHHTSPRHPRMSMSNRAAQFSPFSALTDYADEIKVSARLTDQKPELTESEKADLDYKLQIACGIPGDRPTVMITYFVPDQKKSGGSCLSISGKIKKLMEYDKQIVLGDNTRIDIDSILNIDGDIFSTEGIDGMSYE